MEFGVLAFCSNNCGAEEFMIWQFYEVELMPHKDLDVKRFEALDGSHNHDAVQTKYFFQVLRAHCVDFFLYRKNSHFCCICAII